MKKQIKIFIIIQLIVLVGTACSSLNARLAKGTQISSNGIEYKDDQIILPTESIIEEELDSNDLAVSLALTNESVQVLTVESEQATAEIIQMTMESGQATGTAQAIFDAIPTQTPTQSFTPTSTIEPTITPTPDGWIPSPTPAECLAIKFVEDVNVPDGSYLHAGDEFYKTWRFQNVGSCVWREDFTMVFIMGDQMGAPTPVLFNKEVYPDEYVNLTMPFIAPEQNGTYRGDFKMMDSDGTIFGIGDEAELTYYVIIQVVDGEEVSP